MTPLLTVASHRKGIGIRFNSYIIVLITVDGSNNLPSSQFGKSSQTYAVAIVIVYAPPDGNYADYANALGRF